MIFQKSFFPILLGSVLVIISSTTPVALAKPQPFSAEVSFSRTEPLEGESTRIYVHITNNDVDNRGVVRVFDEGKQIGPDTPFSVLRGKTADAYADYDKLPYGEREITVKVFTFGDNSSSIATQKIFVDRDSDRDTIPDKKDPDDDNDGVLDEKDAFPLNPRETLDTDKDGTGDNADPDDDADGLTDDQEKKIGTDAKKSDTDSDGTLDGNDAFPLDPKESLDTDKDGMGNNADPDDDNDKVLDEFDALPIDPTDSVDSDRDGIGDRADTDLDNDGLSNVREKEQGTDPQKKDTDGDGIGDMQDVFPNNTRESKDTDHDGLGDTADTNNTNQGPVLKYKIPDTAILWVPYYFDASQSIDPDGKITELSWTVGGVTKNKPAFWYFFILPGNHEVVLLAIDDAGEKRSVVKTIWVSPVIYIFILLGGIFAYVTYRRVYGKIS